MNKIENSSKGNISPGTPESNSFPDGGFAAWFCVAGGFCCAFCSFGWANGRASKDNIACIGDDEDANSYFHIAIGVFQEYYETNLLSSYSASTISWIVSCETFFMFFGAPFVGSIYDNFGPRWLLFAGTFLHVFGLMVGF